MAFNEPKPLNKEQRQRQISEANESYNYIWNSILKTKTSSQSSENEVNYNKEQNY